MRYPTHFIISGILAALVLSSLSGCSAASRSFGKGEKLEQDGRYEEAMYSYADAFMKDPESGPYRVRFLKSREKAADQRFKRGNELFSRNQYAAALTEFQTAFALDPTQERFRQQAVVTARLKDAQAAFQEGVDFEKANKLKDAHRSFTRALELDQDNRDYQAALARIAGHRKSKLDGFELNLKSAKPITLKFKDAKLRDVFTIITQLSGINFIFDDTVKDQSVTILLENATFQQCVELLCNMYKLERKVANENTVLVYPKTPDKIKQYEDMVVRTFHLNYMEAKKAINLIRTMIQVRKVYVNEESNAIVVRDTRDIVDVMEKILDANDVPDPEVVLDVEVIEISDKDARNVGLLLSNYNVQLGAFNGDKLLSNSLTSATSSSTTASGTTTTTTAASIDNLIRAFTLKGYGGFVTVPNAQYNFGKTLTKGEVLSNPKIRVKNKEKSKFNVGTRVPITTTTLNGTVSQVNVQYVDVGVKVNAEPNIQLNNEIVIKLSLEVSSILNKENVGGSDSLTTVVTIGTRNLETVLSLKDGETSIIGGLIQNTTSDSKQKVFLLGDLPIIGPLISNTNASKEKTELLLAITPRLVRGVTVPQSALTSFASGKEDDPSLVKSLGSFEQEPVFEAAPKEGEKQSPASPKASTAAPQAAVPSPPAAAAPAAKAAPVPLVAAPAPAPAKTQKGILQISAPSTASVGQQVTLEVKVSDVAGVSGAPFVLTYDPVYAEFLSATEGGFLKQDGKPTTFSVVADPGGGTVTVNLARVSGSGGVSGGGSLATMLFRVKNQGSAGFGFRSAAFTAADGRPVAVLPFSTAMEVR